jgi:hypothetical protein
MGAPIKYDGGMSLEAIAAAENTTPAAIHMCLSRALRKLRRQGLLITCRELAEALQRGRNTENIVRTARRR